MQDHTTEAPWRRLSPHCGGQQRGGGGAEAAQQSDPATRWQLLGDILRLGFRHLNLIGELCGANKEALQVDTTERSSLLFPSVFLHRLKSSFVLGHDQPTEIQKPKKKNLKSKVNPITGQVEAGEAGGLPLAVEEKIVERFEKSCKIPPGGHSTPLW